MKQYLSLISYNFHSMYYRDTTTLDVITSNLTNTSINTSTCHGQEHVSMDILSIKHTGNLHKVGAKYYTTLNCLGFNKE